MGVEAVSEGAGPAGVRGLKRLLLVCGSHDILGNLTYLSKIKDSYGTFLVQMFHEGVWQRVQIR